MNFIRFQLSYLFHNHFLHVVAKIRFTPEISVECYEKVHKKEKEFTFSFDLCKNGYICFITYEKDCDWIDGVVALDGRLRQE